MTLTLTLPFFLYIVSVFVTYASYIYYNSIDLHTTWKEELKDHDFDGVVLFMALFPIVNIVIMALGFFIFYKEILGINKDSNLNPIRWILLKLTK